MSSTEKTPRVWFDGDEIPAGVWTYRVEVEDIEDRVEMVDPDEPCENGNLGPLVEIVIPDDVDAIVLAEAKKRDIKVDYCTQCQEWTDIQVRNGDDTACFDCAANAEAASA